MSTALSGRHTLQRNLLPDPRHAVVRHVRPGTVVILDNARIHKDPGFVREINAAGGIVRFLPPYCFDLTPLDNGAFGMVKRFDRNLIKTGHHDYSPRRKMARWRRCS